LSPGERPQMRVALVHDWLDTWGGGESVLAELLRTFPGSDVYTLVDFLRAEDRVRLDTARITTSSLQHLPGARRWFRHAAVLCPQLIERFDLVGYDVVISDSHAIAKGARIREGQIHVCYCHTPARFAWSTAALYADRAGASMAWRLPLIERALERFRRWDLATSARVGSFVANSRHTAAAIARCYGRDAEVIYPPVDCERFATAATDRGLDAPRTGYVTVSRLVPYKRVDVLVEAFRLLPDRRLIVVGDGPERSRLEALSVPNVTFAGRQDNTATTRLVAAARAFLFAVEEDFGIAPVEAQAAGTPVIAYGRGGARESIRGQDERSPTGVFFDAQTPHAVVTAIRLFESDHPRISAAACRDNALRFAPARFRAEIARAVEVAMAKRTRTPVFDA
jgi:glycosyltransferase involved in cell wall biosynthesis